MREHRIERAEVFVVDPADPVGSAEAGLGEVRFGFTLHSFNEHLSLGGVGLAGLCSEPTLRPLVAAAAGERARERLGDEFARFALLLG